MPSWIPRPGLLSLRVAARNLRVWGKYAKASSVGNFLDPLLYLLILGAGLGQIVKRAYFGGATYMEFLSPGILASTAMNAATFECTFGAYTRMTHQGTYAGILATPVTVDDLIAGEALFGAFKAALGGTAVLLVSAALGLVHSPLCALVPACAFVVGLLFSTVALIVTALSPSYEFFNYYLTLALTPMLLLSGIFFPVAELPTPVRAVASWLPLTRAVDLMRGLMLGQFRTSAAGALALLAAAGLIALAPATVLVRRRMIR